MEKYDVAIIGGGVVGCAILNKLTRLNKKCILLEIADDVATGMSRANTGLIHAGFDAKEGTLKQKLNVLGNAMFDKLCAELSVPFRRNGALVVGNNFKEILKLYNRGASNGVEGMQILENDELKALEPNLHNSVQYGLYAPSAGIISPYEFTVALAEESVLNGATVAFNYKLKTHKFIKNVHHLFNGKLNIKCDWVINSAGYGYNDVARILGAEVHALTFRSGEYHLLDKSEGKLVSHSIFPLPSKTSKGVVVTPTIDGNLLIGPNATEIDSYSTATSSQGLNEVKNKAGEFISQINFKKNIRNFAGVRVSAGEDFIIEKSKHFSSIINLAGICSPGLTSSPAIAEYVAELMGLDKYQEKKMIRRQPIIKVAGKSNEEVSELISKNKDYSKIICRCEEVSLAEIIQALNSPLKPRSIDAIKRRTRAGMGRCQGGFCTDKVLMAIANKYGVELEEVDKENAGSNILVDNIKKGNKNGKK